MTANGKYKRISTGDVLLVARRWAWRGDHTEYTHFLSWFPDARIVTTQDALKRPYFLLKKIAGWTRREAYTSYSLGIELAAMLHMILKRPKAVIFWYADHEYHYSWMVAKLLGIKVIGNFFFSLQELERRVKGKGTLKHLDLITASGKKQMAYLKKFSQSGRIGYVPLGIDTDFFTPPKNKNSRRGNHLILHVGLNRRDFETLKQVYQNLTREIKGLKLELIGAESKKESFREIKSATVHSFMNDEKLLTAYQNASLLLLPLLEGGSSQTLNEAMATGLPVVTNRLPNLEDYTEGSGVLTSQVGDVTSMTEHCLRLLTNGNYWESISKQVREHALRFNYRNSRDCLFQACREHLNMEFVPPEDQCLSDTTEYQKELAR